MSGGGTLNDVLREAAKHIGYHEGRNADGTWNNVTEFGKRYGWNGVAWCQIYMWCVFEDAGAHGLVPKVAGCIEAYDWYAGRLRTGSVPRRGALIYFGDPAHHVGIVEAVTSDTITYISGNTGDGTVPAGVGNAVERKNLRRRNLVEPIRFAYPNYVPELPPKPVPAPPPKPRGLRVLTVRRGQTLGGIAAAAGVSLALLLLFNPSHKHNPNMIHPGDRITIPATPHR
jgi:LysM repeat protein